MAGENSYKGSIDQVKTDIQTIVEYMTQLDAKVASSATNLANAAKKLSASTPGDMSGNIEAQKKGFTELNAVMAEQSRQAEKLALKKKSLTMLTGQEVENNRILARNASEQVKLQSTLVGAYEKLNIQRNIAKRNLQNLLSAENKNTAAIKKAQKEYDVLSAKINKANSATQNFAKGGVGSAIRGLKNLAGAFGFVGGLYLFADMAKQAFQLAKKLDSLNFAMKAIITDSTELERAQYFLASSAEKYGAEIVSLTERYIKFTAAAKQSGVAMKDTENIFASFTKVSGVLGLRSDELNGVFLALEQMLSKGKVTTEELRRQLGERLPGAFGIMAQTLQVLNPDMEITVQTLDDMLKKGQVLSAEVLPEFARQVEKSFGIENVERVDTLAAANARMSNAWVALVGDITEGGGIINKSLSAVMNGIAGFLSVLSKTPDAIQVDEYKNLSDQLNSNAKAFGSAAKESSKLLSEYQDLTKEGVVPSANEKLRLEQIVLSLTDKLGDSVLKLNEETGAMELNTDAVRTMIKAKRLAMDVEASQMAIRYMNAKDSKEALTEQRKVIADELRIRESMITENERKIEKAIASGAAQYADKPLPENIASRNQTLKELRDVDAQITEQTKRIKSNSEMLSGLGYNEAEIQALLGQADAVEDVNNRYANREFIYKKLTEAKANLAKVNHGDDDAKNAVQAEIDILEKALEYWDGAAKKKGKAIKDYTADDAFKLLETRLKIEIDTQKEILDNEEGTLEQRLEANQRFQERSIELLNFKAEYEVAKAGQRKDLVLAIRMQQEYDEQKLMEESLDRIKQIQSDDFDKRIKQFDELKEKDKETLDARVLYMKQAMHKRGATAEEIEEAIYQMEYEYLEKRLQDQINYAHKELVIIAMKGDQTKESLEEIKALEDKLIDMRIDKRQKDADDEKKTLEERKQATIEYLNAIADIGGQLGALFSALSTNHINKIDEELSAMNEMYDKQLDNENLTAERRKEIEDERERRTAELEKKKKEEKIKAMQAEKKFALFEIAMATAIAVMQAAPNVPLQILVAALGALQAATVIATPIPKYAKGRKGGKEEMAILGDGGKHEPILDKHGNLRGISPNTPTLMKLDKGDSVLPSTSHLSKDYQSILNASVMTTLASASVNNDSDKLAKIFDQKLSNLKSEMRSGIKEGFQGVKLPKNSDISRLANELNFNRKRDAI